METFIIQSSNKSMTQKLKTILDDLKLHYELKSTKKEEVYNSEFVQMVLERSKNAKKGETIPYTDALRKELFDI